MKSASPLVYLGIGAAIATGALFLMSQSVPPTSPNYSGAYPARKNVVNIFNWNGGTIPFGQEIVVYTVPSDRWLTVTDCQAYTTGGTVTDWGENNGGLFIARGIAGAASSSYAYHTPVGSQVGWVFPPGSVLVLKNTGSTQTINWYWYYVTGYLSRE